jgi:hypothetical protein
MTLEQQEIIKSYVNKCSQIYHSASITSATFNVQKTFEKNESDDTETLGVKLGDAILDLHFLTLQEHQKPAFYDYWTKVAEEAKSV